MWVLLLLIVSTFAGPVYPPPSYLWSPSNSSVPESGDYFLVLYDYRDPRLYTPLDSVFNISLNEGQLQIQVTGNDQWNAIFQVMTEISTLELGFYETWGYPSSNQSIAGFIFGKGPLLYFNERINGFVVIDEISYQNKTLDTLELRFGFITPYTPGYVGALRYLSSDHRPPIEPPPIPADLWTPSVVLPPTGNVVYLQSQGSDPMGKGHNYTYTYLNSNITIKQELSHIEIKAHGYEWWYGYFQPARLQMGFYANVTLYPYNPPNTGGILWHKILRECKTAAGWFAVDDVQYDSTNSMTALSMRFAQYCNGASDPLYGSITWAESNPSIPPGPVFPPPEGLWMPSEGVLPEGNYVYLESQVGDGFLDGKNLTYTSINSALTFSVRKNQLSVLIAGDLEWSGVFVGMQMLPVIEPGFYGNLQEFSIDNKYNPALGALEWSGSGACSNLRGWFAIDKLSIAANGTLQSVSMRFEQHCEGVIPALHGALNWDSLNPVNPPGPEYPSPSDLWTPSMSLDSPVYAYLESDPGDPVGEGLNYTYLSQVSVTEDSSPAGVTMRVNGTDWFGYFQVMTSLSQIEPGYYSLLGREVSLTPVRGGSQWSFSPNFCRTLQSWVVVDQVTYGDNGLESLQLRFEQVCDGSPPLHGALSWKVGPAYF